LISRRTPEAVKGACPATPVTLDRLVRILRNHSVALQQRIAAPCPMTLSLPTDGRGIRVRVSVPAGCGSQVPGQINFTLDGQEDIIPLEVQEGFPQFALHTHSGSN